MPKIVFISRELPRKGVRSPNVGVAFMLTGRVVLLTTGSY
jgi:hypothetical protein